MLFKYNKNMKDKKNNWNKTKNIIGNIFMKHTIKWKIIQMLVIEQTNMVFVQRNKMTLTGLSA